MAKPSKRPGTRKSASQRSRAKTPSRVDKTIAGPAPRSSNHSGKSKHSIELIARGVLVRGTEVLLCQNLKHGYFYLPGGHVEFSESARATAEREFLEETGLRVRAGRLVLASEGIFATRKRPHHELNLVFHVELAGQWTKDVDVLSREEHIAFSWVDLAAIPETEVRPLAAKAFLAAGAGRFSEVPLPEWVSEIP